jgi:hypothetical protein
MEQAPNGWMIVLSILAALGVREIIAVIVKRIFAKKDEAQHLTIERENNQ